MRFLGDRIFAIQFLFFRQQFCKRDSSLRPGDSHPFDVGLGRSPPVDFPGSVSVELNFEHCRTFCIIHLHYGLTTGGPLCSDSKLC